uniref:Na+/H+ antiporter subunit C n=1 Tax=Ignisphaera aggregans TaxID=334771 RepID=A0A7C5XII1_9CREN
MSDVIVQLALRTSIVAFIVNIAIALYGILSRPSLIKKYMCLLIFTDSINLFAIFLGFRLIRSSYPSPPILSREPETIEDLERFVEIAVDPLPQALTLTAIVIGLATSMFILGLILMYYEHYKTTDIHVGEVEEVEESSE